MDKKILGNRYELIEKIGGGGMALVYKARCKLLNRYVAVKILRPEFTDDEEFVKRFRIEAQAAASLSHPNIVPIYDVGCEDSIHYIVMEYVEGITLKEYITQKGSMDWKESVSIAIKICLAIKQAHRKHIVHRDIKPHNILITREGVAKVTDFGIAKAVTSSTVTIVGNTLGSVHYFSPEQARGSFTDEKSDLYSIGIVLYEMVTGKIPFDGDTPVAIALKHIQDQAIEPMEIDENIPRGLNDIIMKLIKKDQNKRYQKASEILEDLYKVFEEPDGEFVAFSGEDDSPTMRVKGVGDADLKNRKKTSKRKKKDYRKKGARRDKYTALIAIITSIIIIAVFAVIGYKIVIPALIPETVDFEVGDYIERNYYDVKEELEKENIDTTEKRVFSDSIEKDIIISQNIEAGKELRAGGDNTIEFEVSDGPELIKIPELAMKETRLAEAELKRLGLTFKTEQEFNETIANGLVIRTEPGFDEEIKPEDEVTIFESKGPELELVIVPDLTGKTKAEAQKLLVDAKLAIGTIYPEGFDSLVHKIIQQHPVAQEEVEEGTAVDIYFEEDNIVERVFVNDKIVLSNPNDYDDIIKVIVEATPSDTHEVESIMNKKWNKSSFPIPVTIPVPKMVNGRTKVRVLLDNVFYNEYYIENQ